MLATNFEVHASHLRTSLLTAASNTVALTTLNFTVVKTTSFLGWQTLRVSVIDKCVVASQGVQLCRAVQIWTCLPQLQVYGLLLPFPA